MVRGERIKHYDFPAGSLISPAGALDVYSQYPLNGELLAIYNAGADNPGSWVKTGSLTFSVSGPAVTFYVWKSGTAVASEGIVIKDTHFVRASLRTTAGSSLAASGLYDTIPLNSKIRLQGAGLGTGKSGLGISIIYR